MKNLANQIVNWMKEYAITSNRKAWVVGVSGGVDSALVSTLCAMTELPTYCVILPCESKMDGIDKAQKHISSLNNRYGNIAYNYVDLTPTFQTFSDNLPSSLKDNYLAYANAKSRLRMIALYHIATVHNGLVVGTGNKIEDFGVGFFTKYGDGGVDISPIADLTKTEVRQMAKELGVDNEIVTVAPTDGLWPDGRTDESQLGASYEELEWAMNYMSKSIYSDDIHEKLTERQWQVLKIYNRLHAATAHKLNPIPTFKRALYEKN